MKTKKYLSVITVLIFCIFWSGCTCKKFNKKCDDSNSETKCEQKDCINQLFSLKSNISDIRIEVWTEKKEYFYNENINFYFKATKDCYVTIFHKNINGKTLIVFPNKLERDNFVKADKTYMIPEANYGFEMQVDSKIGIEQIKAIATSENISLLDADFNNTFFEIKKEDIDICKKIIIIPEKLSKTKWAEYTYSYKINKSAGQNGSNKKGLKKEEGMEMPKPIPSAGVIQTEMNDSTSLK